MASKKMLTPEERQKKLEEDIRLFMKRGGKIKKIPTGASGENPWQTRPTSVRPCSQAKVAPHIAPGFTV